MAELAPIYPNVGFLSEVAPGANPLTQKIITNVYLSAYFGQGEAGLTRKLASAALDHEFGFWLPDERQCYPSARDETVAFFAQDGISALAEASQSANYVGVPERHVIGRKYDLLTYSWESTKADLKDTPNIKDYGYTPRNLWRGSGGNPKPPDTPKLEIGPDTPTSAVWASIKKDWQALGEDIRLTRDFIAADTHAITNGRQYGFGLPQHEGLVQRLIMAGAEERRIPSAGFSHIFFEMLHQVTVFGGMSAYLRGNYKAWKPHHPTENFYTDQYTDVKTSRSRFQRIVCPAMGRALLRS